MVSAPVHQASINEDYDAPDYQNMFLAAIDPSGVIHRSFDRPRLRNFLTANPRTNFRAQVQGTNEVDNDGDGVNDGIWIDIGLPLQTDNRGRVYKPLVSYLVLDMDGRINVSAHGQLADLSPNGFVSNRVEMLNGEPPVNLGRGFGPAEISMNQLFSAPETAGLITSRYGNDLRPGVAGTQADIMTVNKWFSHPTASVIGDPTGANGGLYGSPLDWGGRFATGTPAFGVPGLRTDPFDSTSARISVPNGMPIVDWTPDPATGWPSIAGDELSDNPYEMSFRDEAFASIDGGIDAPFDAREMERVLRRFDSDTKMLPSRLRDITESSLDADPTLRNAFTHASWEVPVPPSNVVTDLRNRLLMEVPGADDEFLNGSVYRMLSADLIDGLKMDPNRPGGNGVDGDGDRIVDEIWHGGTLRETETIRQAAAVAAGFVNVEFDHDGFSLDPLDANITPHQIFARHLYVLTLLMTEIDLNGDGVFNTIDWHEYDGLGGVNQADIHAYRTDIAQWAINVANFRDRDSIMHPFEFDLEPFDGWDVDHVLGPPAAGENPALTRVVWGVERPEMLLSEAMANHDRATEDRNDDDSMRDMAEKNTMNHPTTPGEDSTLDSRFVPRASVFIELYNPWITAPAVNSFNLTYPPELYGAGGIDLARMAGNSPVWQIAITRPLSSADSYLDNTDDPRFGMLAEVDVLRRVYFAQPTAMGAEFTGNKVYFPDAAIEVGGLPPGQHAVVGSSGITDGDQHHTYLGSRTDGDLTQTRRITLDRDSSSVEQVFFDSGANRINSTTTLVAAVIPIGMQTSGARSLGVTDPINGYGPLAAGAIAPNADGFEIVNPVADIPLDTLNPDTPWAQLQVDGLKDDDSIRRIVHLRRLANPLVPHDADLNPYLTIDSLSMPINVFNGESNVDDRMGRVGQMVVDGMGQRNTPLAPNSVASRERGSNSSASGERMLWQSDQARMNSPAALYPATDFGSADGHFHSFNFSNSLGQLDVAYRANPSNNGFPALTWNNRPYISHLELANVPFTSSYRLLAQYGFADSGSFNDFRAAGDDVGPRHGGGGIFPYLLGFHADRSSNGNSNNATNLCRLMDYLEVPSRFIGTETFLNPTIFSSTGSADGLGLNAPFNRVSNYRYPGKININTIFDERVWNGLMRANGMAGNYGSQVPYSVFAAHRERSNQQTVTTGPSDFLNPFRTARSSNLVPEQGLVVSSAETGLFRRRVGTATPLLDSLNPGLASTSTNPNRSPIFRNDMRQRLGNLVTTRSSVFSIWITVGFFEVDLESSTDLSSPTPGDIVFGQEVGSDTGEVQRFRGFYMVDRSIPVGFEPGVNHNVDQAILASSITQRGETN